MDTCAGPPVLTMGTGTPLRGRQKERRRHRLHAQLPPGTGADSSPVSATVLVWGVFLYSSLACSLTVTQLFPVTEVPW